MTALFTKNQKLQKPSAPKTAKETLDSLYLEKAKHEKKFFEYERELEGIQYRTLTIREHQRHHKEKVFALEKQIQKYKKPKQKAPKYDYTSFYVFAALLIAIFVAALYFLFTQFILV